VEDKREDAIANAKLPAGLEADGRDEELESGDLVHPSGAGPHGHTTPPGTALPDNDESEDD
jgi:hypothetical protein